MSELEQKVISIIAATSPLGEDIHSDDDLSMIGIDSIKKVNLIVSLEDRLNIRFSDSDLDPAKLKSVNDIIILVQSCFR
jgi:acyl carrier protein